MAAADKKGNTSGRNEACEVKNAPSKSDETSSLEMTPSEKSIYLNPGSGGRVKSRIIFEPRVDPGEGGFYTVAQTPNRVDPGDPPGVTPNLGK